MLAPSDPRFPEIVKSFSLNNNNNNNKNDDDDNNGFPIILINRAFRMQKIAACKSDSKCRSKRGDNCQCLQESAPEYLINDNI